MTNAVSVCTVNGFNFTMLIKISRYLSLNFTPFTEVLNVQFIC